MRACHYDFIRTIVINHLLVAHDTFVDVLLGGLVREVAIGENLDLPKLARTDTLGDELVLG